MNNMIRIIFIGLLSCAFGSNAWARNFRVEVLVFHQDSPTSEIFDQAESRLDWPAVINPKFVENIYLQKAYYSLSANYAYKPVYYKSWIQSVGPNRVSKGVQIKKDSLLNGFVRIQRGHYVHLLVDLEYAPDSVYTETPLIYSINEKRKVKLNEIHYFDHPKFGVIATIRPL